MAEDPVEDDELEESGGKKKKKKPKPPGKPKDWPLIAMVGGTAFFVLFFAAVTIMAPRRPMLFIRAIGEAMAPAIRGAPKVALTPSSGTPAATPQSGAPATGGTPTTPAPGADTKAPAKPAEAKPADTKPPEPKPPAKP